MTLWAGVAASTLALTAASACEEGRGLELSRAGGDGRGAGEESSVGEVQDRGSDPAGTAPVEGKPEEGKPEEGKPADDKPADGKPGDTSSPGTKPETEPETKPDPKPDPKSGTSPETKPGDGKPGDATSGDTKSGEAGLEAGKSAVVVNVGLPTTRATIGGQEFTLEVAADAKSREIGMMGRKEVKERTGMVFVFPRQQFGVLSFWMKNCLTDLDIVYLDNSGRILSMHTMTKPEARKEGESEAGYESRLQRYSSIYPCGIAVEIAPGAARKLGLKVGDQVKLDLASLKKLAK